MANAVDVPALDAVPPLFKVLAPDFESCMPRAAFEPTFAAGVLELPGSTDAGLP
jgi:hypothetical protein